MAKRDVRVFLLVRADPRESGASLTSLLALLPGVPVHWSIPTSVLSGPDAGSWELFLEELGSRRPLDSHVAMGYSGAPHPLLQLEELRRELEWGLRAPAGAEGTFRPLAGVMAPTVADLLRPDALRLYSSKGVRRLLVSARGLWSTGVELGAGSSGLQVLHCHPIDEAASLRVSRLLARIGEGPLGLVAEAAAAADMAALLARLEARSSLTYLRLDQSLEIRGLDGPPMPAPGSDPPYRRRAASVSVFRTHRQGSEETATVLRVLGGLHEVAGPARSLETFPAARRENTAVMLGAVSLGEGALSANFDGGRLRGVAWNGTFVTPALPSRSYVGGARRSRSYEVVSAFALEADRLRGLRSLHRLPDDPASLTVEYFFVEDFPYLLVTGRVRYPASGSLDSVAPLEIPVARLGAEGLSVHVLARGESAYRVTIDPHELPLCLSGSLFWFEGEPAGLLAGFPPVKESVIESVWLRSQRLGQETILFASFFGSRDSCQAPLFLGAEELFSLYLGVSPEPPSVLPVFPRQVLEEIPYHAVSV